MLQEISYYLIFGKPLIMYLGVATMISLLATATIGFLNYTGRKTIPFKWHPRMAALTIILAVVHGVLGVLLYF
ncbi:MAG: hypothetical protein PHS02_01060 [Candidatus ainarchaeum sp.]|nr:hypothetical protein [Candidatus ainarchaeum sp.]